MRHACSSTSLFHVRLKIMTGGSTTGHKMHDPSIGNLTSKKSHLLYRYRQTKEVGLTVLRSKRIRSRASRSEKATLSTILSNSSPPVTSSMTTWHSPRSPSSNTFHYLRCATRYRKALLLISPPTHIFIRMCLFCKRSTMTCIVSCPCDNLCA